MKTIILISALVFVVLFTGCSTPESVKGSVYMSIDAIGQAKTLLHENESVVVGQMLGDAQSLLKPVLDYVGMPENPQVYDAESAKYLKLQAEQDVRFQKMLESFEKKLLSKIPYADLFITKDEAKNLGGIDMNELILAFIAYLGASKGTNALLGKLGTKKKS